MGYLTAILNNGAVLSGPTSNGTTGQVLTGDGAGNLDFATIDLSQYQPLDSDLTAIAALSTTAFGRGLLELANQAALLSAAGAAAASHTHAQADVTNLTTDLAAKVSGTTGTTADRIITSTTTDKVVQAAGYSANTTGLAATATGKALGSTSLPWGSVYVGNTSSDRCDIYHFSSATYINNQNGASGSVQLAVGSTILVAGQERSGAGGPIGWVSCRGLVAYGRVSMGQQAPSQITSNQNNYNPGGIGAVFYRLSSDASRNITGFSIGQADAVASGSGAVVEFWNVGSNDIVLKHEDANSTAGNRFLNNTAADITLAAGEQASLTYDTTTGRWRVRKLT
jgi:hypothetical protein